MKWLRGVVLGLALIEGGWLAYDGAHALIAGDYVTPRAGKYAGQLGPWSRVVAAVGLDPRSTLVKSIHLGLGAVGLAVAACFALGASWAWAGMMSCAVAGLWYLPFGTLLSIIQIVVLMLPGVRRR